MGKLPRDYIIQLVTVFFTEHWLIKKILTLGFVLLLLVSFLAPKQFYFNGQVVVVSKQIPHSLDGSLLNSKQDVFVSPTLTDMETEANILRSPAIIYHTLLELHQSNLLIIDDPNWIKINIIEPLKSNLKDAKKTIRGWFLEPLTPEEEQHIYISEFTEEIIESLEIVTLPGSNILTVDLIYDDIIIGKRIATRLLKNYLIKRKELILSSFSDEFYFKHKNLFEEKIKALEEQKLRLLKENDANLPDLELEAEISMLEQEQKSLEENNQIIKQKQEWQLYLEREYDRLSTKKSLDSYEFPYTFNTSPRSESVAFEDQELVSQLQILNELSASYRDINRVYEQDTRAVRDITAKLKQERNRYLKLIQNKILEANQQLTLSKQIIEDKRASISFIAARVKQLRDVLPQFKIIDTELKALQDAYFSYTQQYHENKAANFAEFDVKSNVKILAWPQTPLKPVFPNPKLLIPIGGIALLMLSISMAFMIAFFRQVFRRPEEITDRLGLPVIAVFEDIDTERWSAVYNKKIKEGTKILTKAANDQQKPDDKDRGLKALTIETNGHLKSPEPTLTFEQEQQIKIALTDKYPDEWHLNYILWTRQAVAELIKKKFNVYMPLSVIGNYLKFWGFTLQNPIKRIYVRNPKAVHRWLNSQYSKIKARALEENAEIYWLDNTAIYDVSQHKHRHASKNERREAAPNFNQHSLSTLSATNGRRGVYFKAVKGTMNEEVFINCCDRLIQLSKQKIYLISDDLCIYHADTVKHWIDNNKKIEVFYLPTLLPKTRYK